MRGPINKTRLLITLARAQWPGVCTNVFRLFTDWKREDVLRRDEPVISPMAADNRKGDACSGPRTNTGMSAVTDRPNKAERRTTD
jgi:hypothetical protein